MVSTTRSTICLTLDSRSGEPSLPRKYFDATTFVAVCDQNLGTSTPFCSKTLPLSPGMDESRSSHSTSSYGWTPSRVKWRWIRSRCCPSVAINEDWISAIAMAARTLRLLRRQREPLRGGAGRPNASNSVQPSSSNPLLRYRPLGWPDRLTQYLVDAVT